MDNTKAPSIEQILRRGLLLSLAASIVILAAVFIPSIYVFQKKSSLDEINQEAETYKKYIGTHIHNVYLRLLQLGKNHFIVNSLVNPETGTKDLGKLLQGEASGYFVKKVIVVDSEENILYQTKKDKTIKELGLYMGRTYFEGKTEFHKDITGKRFFISTPILYYETPQGALLFEIDPQALIANLKLPPQTGLELDLQGINVKRDYDFDSYLQVKKSFDLKEMLDSLLVLHISKDRIFSPIYKFTFSYLLLMIVFLVGAIWFSRRITNKLLFPLMTLKKMIEDNLNLDQMKLPIVGETKEIVLIRESFYYQAMELKKINHHLEELVIHRTRKLDELSMEHIFYKTAIIKSTIVSETDVKGVIKEVNDNFCRVSGYGREELIGANMSILSSDFHQKNFWDELWDSIEKGDVWRDEICNLKKSGETYWVDAYIIPRMDANDHLISFLTIQNDITDRKKIEGQIKEEKEKAEYATKAKSQFLATVTHEIRTPMNAILAMSEILMESSNLSEEERKYIILLNNSGKTLVQIINDILDFSKIENGSVELENEIFNLDQLIVEIVDLFRPLAEKKGIALNLVLDTQNILRMGDTTRIKQIFFNLVGNALKFTSEGSITIMVEGLEEDVHVEILDTGIGIPSDKQDKIFERFTQADASINRNFGGTGLGLNISQNLIKLMNGNIKLKSELNIGSTFLFDLKLPISSDVKDKENDEVEERKFKIGQLEGEILIVDDSLVNIEVLRLFLKKSKIKVETAVNGEMALKIMAVRNFDLIFMDIEMPVMDGVTAIKKIRMLERHKECKNKVVALSAHAMEDIKQEILAEGFDFYMSKPISKQKFQRFLLENLEDGQDKKKDVA